MILLSKPCRQLVVEAALAGVNHSLLKEARDILNVLPQLIPDPQVCLLCEAMLRFGLNEQERALALLATSSTKEAKALLALLQQGISSTDKKAESLRSHRIY